MGLALGGAGADFLPLDAALRDWNGGAFLDPDELAALLHLLRANVLHRRVAFLPRNETRR